MLQAEGTTCAKALRPELVKELKRDSGSQNQEGRDPREGEEGSRKLTHL